MKLLREKGGVGGLGRKREKRVCCRYICGTHWPVEGTSNLENE